MSSRSIKLLFRKSRIAIPILLLFGLIACNSIQGGKRYNNSDLGITFLYPRQFDVRDEEIVNRTCTDASLFKNEYDAHCTIINFGRDDQEIWDVGIETFPNDQFNLKGDEILNNFLSIFEESFGEEKVRLLSYNASYYVDGSSNYLYETYTFIVNIDRISQPNAGNWVTQRAVMFIGGENESAIIIGDTITFKGDNFIDSFLQTVIESAQFD